MKYGDRIRNLRLNLKLSQDDVASRLKINRSTYTRYELSQTQPEFNNLIALSNMFNVSIDYIISGQTTGDSEDYYKKLYQQEIKKQLDELESTYVKKKTALLEKLNTSDSIQCKGRNETSYFTPT